MGYIALFESSAFRAFIAVRIACRFVSWAASSSWPFLKASLNVTNACIPSRTAKRNGWYYITVATCTGRDDGAEHTFLHPSACSTKHLAGISFRTDSSASCNCSNSESISFDLPDDSSCAVEHAPSQAKGGTSWFLICVSHDVDMCDKGTYGYVVAEVGDA